MIWVCVTCFVFFSCSQMVIGSLSYCVHGGIKYRDGDYFPPNKTFIKTEDPRQCVQCRCHQGLVICEIENCTFANCENPTRHSRFCCLRCPGNLQEEPSIEKASDFVFGQGNGNLASKKKKITHCTSNGQNYENGSVWQPVIGPFGAMACVQCHCQEGSVVCGRLQCNQQPCSHPKREFGECCPVCPPSGALPRFGAFCLPKASELFVFKTPDVQNDSEMIQYAFLDNTDKGEPVTLFTWNLKTTASPNVLSVKMYSRKDLSDWNFRLLGSVNQRRFKKFSQRGGRLRSRCTVECFKKIERLENSLRIYPVTSRNACSQNEVDVSNLDRNRHQN